MTILIFFYIWALLDRQLDKQGHVNMVDKILYCGCEYFSECKYMHSYMFL